jgi:hypothetical protein
VRFVALDGDGGSPAAFADRRALRRVLRAARGFVEGNDGASRGLPFEVHAFAPRGVLALLALCPRAAPLPRREEARRLVRAASLAATLRELAPVEAPLVGHAAAPVLAGEAPS